MGVQKGDRVTIYMPMILEAAYAMLACARIGAVHSIVFGGFSPEVLAERITDCDSQFTITADEGVRGGRSFPLKENVDKTCDLAGGMVEKVLVVRRTGNPVNMVDGRDRWLHEAADGISTDCPRLAGSTCRRSTSSQGHPGKMAITKASMGRSEMNS